MLTLVIFLDRIVPRVPPPISIRTKLFYSLHKGPKYIKQNAQTYWQYLTLDSYHVYEAIYRACNPLDGKVTCT